MSKVCKNNVPPILLYNDNKTESNELFHVLKLAKNNFHVNVVHVHGGDLKIDHWLRTDL